MFSFGWIYGELRGFIKTIGLPLVEPTPMKWKKIVLDGFDWKGKKEIIFDYCYKKYPNISLLSSPRCKKPHDGMADAIGLADYGFLTYNKTII